MTDPYGKTAGGLAAARGARQDVLDAELLRELRAINERGIALLQERARLGGPREASRRAADLEDWRVLDAGAAQRLAAQPFLLFGVGLEDAARWRLQGPDGVGEAPAARDTQPDWLPEGAAYARLLTHYAWHLARTAPRTAALVAGMPPATTTALRECPVEQLDALAQRSAAWLQLRWHDQPAVWAGLLAAAGQAGSADAARTATLLALQRLGAAHACAAVAEPPPRETGIPGQRPPSLW